MRIFTGALTATGTTNAFLFTPDPAGPDNQLVIGFGTSVGAAYLNGAGSTLFPTVANGGGTGTYTSTVVEVDGQPLGAQNWYPIALISKAGGVTNATNTSLTNNTPSAYTADIAGMQTLRFLASSGTIGGAGIALEGNTDSVEHGPILNNNINATSSYTFSGGITFNAATGLNTITVPTAEASALNISDGTNVGYMTVNTSTCGVSFLGYSSGATAAGGAITATGGPGGATSGAGGAVTFTGGAGTTNAVGGVFSGIGGAGQGSGNGAASKITGGAGGATGVGGQANVTGGASGGASGTAGAATVDAGAATGGTTSYVAIADVNAVSTYLNRGALKSLIVGTTLTALTGSQNYTPTTAQLLGGILSCTGQTGGGTVTVPTGTAMSAAMPRAAVVGDTFVTQFNCITGQALTITAGASGSTVTGTAAVPSGKNATLTFTNTGANAWTCFVNVSA